MKHRLSILFAVVSTTLLAQKHIELVVSDTVYLKSTEVTVKVHPPMEQSFFGIEMPMVGPEQEEDEVTGLSTTDQLVLTSDHLKAKGYQCEKLEDGFGFLVKLKDAGAMEKLKTDLSAETYTFETTVEEAKYESPELYFAQLYNGLFQSAKIQGEMLAKSMGLRLGAVIYAEEISDKEGDGGLYTEMMQQYSKMNLFKDMFKTEVSLTQPYVRTFRYRFEVL